MNRLECQFTALREFADPRPRRIVKRATAA